MDEIDEIDESTFALQTPTHVEAIAARKCPPGAHDIQSQHCRICVKCLTCTGKSHPLVHGGDNCGQVSAPVAVSAVPVLSLLRPVRHVDAAVAMLAVSGWRRHIVPTLTVLLVAATVRNAWGCKSLLQLRIESSSSFICLLVIELYLTQMGLKPWNV